MSAWIAPIAAVLGVFALPLGLLPSAILFRDLANGTDTDGGAERRYRLTVWGGLLGAYLVGVATVAATLAAIA